MRDEQVDDTRWSPHCDAKKWEGKAPKHDVGSITVWAPNRELVRRIRICLAYVAVRRGMVQKEQLEIRNTILVRLLYGQLTGSYVVRWIIRISLADCAPLAITASWAGRPLSSDVGGWVNTVENTHHPTSYYAWRPAHEIAWKPKFGTGAREELCTTLVPQGIGIWNEGGWGIGSSLQRLVS